VCSLIFTWPIARECLTLPDTAVVDMAHPGKLLLTLDARRRGERIGGLACLDARLQCPLASCLEERQNDILLLCRLTNTEIRGILEDDRWPIYFDAYATLLRLGMAAGHRVTFLDPLGDSSIAWTMADIAREQPGIPVAELAALLNLDIETASIIADQAIISHGARITLSDEPWR
jgi:hypothetical protein